MYLIVSVFIYLINFFICYLLGISFVIFIMLGVGGKDGENIVFGFREFVF